MDGSSEVGPNFVTKKKSSSEADDAVLKQDRSFLDDADAPHLRRRVSALHVPESLQPVVALRIWLHLHDQVAGLLAVLVASAGLDVQEEGGEQVEGGADDGQSVGPREVVEVGVHQPVATRGLRGEDECRQEKEDTWMSTSHEL